MNSNRQPVCADLFCGAGGAAMGLHQAGFRVVGFDIVTRPYYPFEFHQRDALTVDLWDYDFVWASPPCHQYSTATVSQRRKGKQYPDLVAATRERFMTSGVPWIMENVIGSPLAKHVVLCGLMFGLKVFRHRCFESSHFLWEPEHPPHAGHRVGEGMFTVVGGRSGGSGWGRKRVRGTKAQWSDAMGGIDWMTKPEMCLAVPPAYSEYLGRQMMKQILQAWVEPEAKAV